MTESRPESVWGGRVQEIDELFKMFRVLGTPNEQLWPGVSKFPDFKATFPKWPPRPIQEVRLSSWEV